MEMTAQKPSEEKIYELWLTSSENVRDKAFQNAPAKVHCISPVAAETFRRGCYRFRLKNPQYFHIELIRQDKTIIFNPRSKK